MPRPRLVVDLLLRLSFQIHISRLALDCWVTAPPVMLLRLLLLLLLLLLVIVVVL